MADATRLAAAARGELPEEAIVFKGDGSVVTAVDVAIEILILSRLEALFGARPTIAEEGPESIGGNPAAEAHCRRLLRAWGVEIADGEARRLLESGGFDGPTSDVDACWVLDPIDGTQGYLDSIAAGGHWCPCLALLRRGRPVLAVNGQPTVDGGVLLVAESGAGCWSRPLAGGDARRLVVEQRPLAEGEPMRIVVPPRASAARLEARLSVARAIGRKGVPVGAESQAKYAQVIAGHADVAYSRRGKGPGQYLWDHAGAVLLARESGAWIGDVDGGAIDCSTGRRLTANRAVICAARGLGPEVAVALAARDASEGVAPPRSSDG